MSALVVVAVLIASAPLVLFYLNGDLDPVVQMAIRNRIGDAKEYDRFYPCGRSELIVPNGKAIVAAVRRVHCAIWGAPSEFDYFVFVHKSGEPDDRASLVFRYSRDDGEKYEDIAPSLTWSSPSELRIGMGIRPTSTFLQTQKNGVTVTYEFGKTKNTEVPPQ
ncbi:MAG: hypothetical protein M3N19_11305 [Candidatus Eremiobacteraeota bacterium]|nr:hypothetical protein [Candidatus Eremiobacteraeota bacterium]